MAFLPENRKQRVDVKARYKRKCKSVTMNRELPVELQTSVNQKALDHICGRGAHSDLSGELAKAVKPLGDVQLFEPSLYGFLVASTQGVIFGVAIGMQGLLFRLDERMKARALATGAKLYPECGDDWVFFELFRDDWPKVDLEFWARKAYVAVRERLLP
jgi:hypothetical protein